MTKLESLIHCLEENDSVIRQLVGEGKQNIEFEDVVIVYKDDNRSTACNIVIMSIPHTCFLISDMERRESILQGNVQEREKSCFEQTV